MATITRMNDNMQGSRIPWKFGSTDVSARYANKAVTFLPMASSLAATLNRALTDCGSAPWGSFVVDGILRRMAMNQNLRTASSIDAQIDMIKRENWGTQRDAMGLN